MKVHHSITAAANSPYSEQAAQQKWEEFAQDNPYVYIWTGLKRNDAKEFWQSGERTIQQEFLPVPELQGVRRGVALELGCGIGRLAFPLTLHFDQVLGVDISQGMVLRATAHAQVTGVANASFFSISGPEDFLKRVGNYAGSCDFIYSLLVFQHISDFSTIEGYLQVTRILLHERGVAYLQFDTRPKTLAYRLKTQLPDSLLPRFWRRGIRRIRRSPEEVTASIRRAGLQIISELTPRTAYHRYLLRVAEG
jgi:SAM-dependent methyltransferase